MSKPTNLQRLKKLASGLQFPGENQVLNAVFQVSPWITPSMTAWMVFDAFRLHLLWWGPKAFLASVIVEINGITSIYLVSYLHKLKARSELQNGSLIIVGVYILTLLFLTLFLDTFPDLAKFAPLSLIAMVVSSNAALIIRAQAKSEQVTRRQPGNTKPALPVSEPEQEPVTVTKPVTAKRKLEILFDTRPDTRNMTSDELAALINCSSANIRKLAHRNGDGLGWKIKS